MLARDRGRRRPAVKRRGAPVRAPPCWFETRGSGPVLVDLLARLAFDGLALRELLLGGVARAGGIVFSSGLLLALPIVVTLLITNVALGVLGRVAPQLNLIAIGFPVTILLGFSGLLFGLSLLATPLLQLYEYSLQSMLGVFVLR